MSRRIFAICLSFAMLFTVSCIRDEALNTEADMETCVLPQAVETIFGESISEVDPNDPSKKRTIYPIVFRVQEGTDRTHMAPKFTLTPGATCQPVSGTVLDFTQSQYYRVTSEDGCWSRIYRITVEEYAGGGETAPDHFLFENARFKKGDGTDGGSFQIFYDTNPMTGGMFDWSSGNAGFALTGTAKNYKDYPTQQTDEGRTGKALMLSTCFTRSFGEMVNMPIAAGSLFLGTFEVKTALSNSLKSTQFGQVWNKVPKRVKGYFKYHAGEKFYELDTSAPHKMREIPGKKDRYDIYAVFYEKTGLENETLDGSNATKTDQISNIVLFGRVGERYQVETDQWREFSFDLEQCYGRKIDPEKLADNKYKFALIFTSSIHGDIFSGAPGSTLWVDDVTVEY